jgi:hypothetical protein
MGIKFDEHEIKYLQESPEVLDLLRNYHIVSEVEADAIGHELAHCVDHHSSRQKALSLESHRLRELREAE